ncbi:MAG: hypothetical protein AAF184_02430 [Pseudomonadota bacterium]
MTRCPQFLKAATLRAALLAVLLTQLAACTTVNRGTTDYFFVDTVPQGAQVSITRTTAGKPAECPSTPCAIARPRADEFVATITYDGYEPVELLVLHSTQRASLNGTVIGNTVVGGGLTVASAALVGAWAGEVVTLGFGGSGFSGAFAAASVPLAGGVVASMAVIDLSTGAGQNLFPNPVVLALAPEGEGATESIDPRVALFEEQLVLEARKDRSCGRSEARYRSEACVEARRALSTKKREIREASKALFTVVGASAEKAGP